MTYTDRMAAAFAAAMLLAPAAQAAPLTQHNVSTTEALAIVNGVMTACNKDGITVTIAVVDKAGMVKLLLGADGGAPHNVELARRKAYTARTYRVPSLEWAKRTEAGSETAGQRGVADVIPLGGGVPIMMGMEPIGGIGVSGGAGGQQGDENCAKAGLAAIANDLK